jgi:biopolymer transport protein ExbD
MSEAKPVINVTPLIDVLLVLLIIFMVIAPTKPSAFKAKVPAEPQNMPQVKENPNALIVKINADSSLTLNRTDDLGTIAEPEKLMEELRETYAQRLQEGNFDPSLATRGDLTDEQKVLRTVFIKAPKNFPYGEVAKVVDAVKQTGADPVGLQIDALD